MVGFVVGASTLTGIFPKLPAGASSDVLGRRPLLVLGTTVFATMPFTYLAVASLSALILIAAGVLVAALGYARMCRVMALIAFSMAIVFAVAARSGPRDVSGHA
jgi:hypothetical protein